MRAHGHAQRPCEGLEDRFGLVVLVVSAGGDVEVAARGAGERMKEVTQHLGGQFTDAFAAEFGLPFEADAAPEVDERHGTAVVHGQDEAIAGDSRLAAPAHGRPPRRARCRHPRRCGARRPTGRLSLRPRVRRLRVWAICASMWSKNPIPVAMRPAPERPSRSSVSVICVSAVRRVRVDAAFAAADELGDPFPRRGDQRAGRFGAGFAQRTAARLLVGGEQDAPRPEIACQQHVGRPVADDVTGREVVASVEIAAEHPRAGFARGGVVGFEGAVDELVVEADAFAFERREHPFVGGPEGRFGERRRAQPVLVGGQYQFEIQSRQRAQPRDGARYEAEFFEAVDLPVDGRFDDQRAVAVDEECFFHGRKVLTVRSRRSFSAGVPTVRRRHPSHPAAREAVCGR